MVGIAKLTAALILLGVLAPSVAFGSLTASPNPLWMDTYYTDLEDYQGWDYLDVEGDTGYFWFSCNKIWNIANAAVAGSENPVRIYVEGSYEDIVVSVRKTNQDEGWMTVLIYKDDSDGVFEPGGDDGSPVETVWVYVDF